MAEQENKSTRKQVFDAIDGERRWQDIKPATGGKSTEVLPAPGELVVMQHLLYQAMLAYAKSGDSPKVMEVIREVAATAVRCLERHGVTERTW